MKKADILVITIVLFLAIGFYAVYFSINPLIDEEASEVVVVYDRLELYSAKYDKNLEVTVNIKSENKTLYVKIDSDNDNIFDEEKTFPINSDHQILNVVNIKNGHIHMIDANCDNKLCMNMRIVSVLSPPIFCTNNVIIKIVSNEGFIIWI